MRPFITKVESNLKLGLRTALEQKTLILGTRGAGKSSIVQAVELATTGKVSDVAGRELVAREADLLALAPGRAGELWAEVKLSDGSSCRWSSEGSTASAKKAKSKRSTAVDPDRCFPLREVLAAIRGSPETSRRFFLQHAAGTSSGEDILRTVPASLHDLLKRAIVAGSALGAPVDKLLGAIVFAKTQIRDLKSRAAVKVPAPSGPCPSDDDVAAVKEELDGALQDLRASEAVLSKREAAASARAKLPAAELAAGKAIEAVTTAQNQLHALPELPAAEDPAKLERRSIAVKLLTFLVEAGVQDCPLCDSPDRHLAMIATLKALEAKAASSEARDDYSAAVADLEDARAEVVRLDNELDRLHAILEAEPPKDAPLPSIATGRVQELQARLAQLEGARAAWRQVKAMEDAAVGATRESSDWSLLVDALEHAVERLLDAGVATFVAKVQEHLPPGDRFSLRLRDGTREVLQVGLERADTIITALSGAEWAGVTAALAAACMPSSGLVVIAPEERAFDPGSLEAAMAAFSSIDGQVLICSPVSPKSVPKGWTVVEAAHARGAARANGKIADGAAKYEADIFE